MNLALYEKLGFLFAKKATAGKVVQALMNLEDRRLTTSTLLRDLYPELKKQVRTLVDKYKQDVVSVKAALDDSLQHALSKAVDCPLGVLDGT